MLFSLCHLPLYSILSIPIMSRSKHLSLAFIIPLERQGVRMILRRCIFAGEEATRTTCCLLTKATTLDTASTRFGHLSRAILLLIFGYSSQLVTTGYCLTYLGKRSACVQYSSLVGNPYESLHSRHHSLATYSKHQNIHRLCPQEIL